MDALFRSVQRVARAVQAIRTNLEHLAELVHRDMHATMPVAEIMSVLRRENTQAELARNWEVILYRHTSKQFVLICAALPDNAKDAQILVNHALNHTRNGCCFCGLVENSFAPMELVEAKSPVGLPIQGELIHPRCALFWQRLKLIAEGR